jgi:hypothetical protein
MTMRVKTYKLIPWISGLTSAGLNNFPSNKLILNGVCISENVPDVLSCDNLIQIDICGECFMPGCTSSGYVQVFEKENIVIWKEPYNKQFEISEEPARGLNAGTIYWDSAMYAKFLSKLGLTDAHKTLGLPIDQAFDLWRINAVKTMFPLAASSLFSIERIEENVMGFYSIDFTSEQSKDIYLSAKRSLLTTESSNISITELTDSAVKIVAMLDISPYKEWDCVYYENGVELFPIGDNLAIRLG